jgi:hypothetical protein
VYGPSPARVVAASVFCWSLATTAVRAEDEGRIHLFGHDYSLIAGASMYVARSAPTRSIYGERAFAPVVDLWDFNRPAGVGLSWDLGAQRLRDGSRRAEFAHSALGPRIQFAGNGAGVAPYFTVRGGACLLHFDGAWNTRPTTNVELGASVLRHFVISGRYDLMPKVRGVDLSGFGVRVAVKVF